ncbi:zinc finger protein 85-like [Argiope bruennichi]|uniref:zinc finger protein 85-like n=1 Tax=Argiope bruennichi TaxID=94029 RepID=UPI0024957FDF|nr:zinc finger protein 85-like [Argiope bruennichi]
MKELRCLNCNEPFVAEQGHRCLNSPWMLENGDENKILEDIAVELDLDKHEFISLAGEQLPELSSVCNEIFQNIFNSSTDANLLKEETAGTDQQTSLFSGDSVMYNKCSVGDTHAVPGPSRLPFNDGKNRLCQEKFQKKPYHLLPKNVKRDTRETCGKVFKERQNFKRHTEIRKRLRSANENTILQDIDDELDPDENEFITLGSGQLPELSTVCTEIFKSISDPCTHSSLSKEVTFGTDQHNSLRPVAFSEKSETYDIRSVSDVHAVPGPSRLPFNESKRSLFQEEFQPKPCQALNTNVKGWTYEVCQKVFEKIPSFRRHMQTHLLEKKHRCDVVENLFF